MLIVTAGCGLTQVEGGPVVQIRPGDVIWCRPGEKHWHGATARTGMTHVAILETLDGKNVEWMQHVTDDEYAAGEDAELAREFGATDIVSERGGKGIARIKEMTQGVGAESVLECVGTAESMMQAIQSTRPGGFIGYVGVPHGVNLDMQELFFTHVRLHGGPAPVREFLPKLIDLVLNGKIDPGKVFDLQLPLEKVADGYRAMDERRAIKAFLQP
jgi:D-arabinose 1-dehydrogenase-like Zn-dependent alcohol dehydrogenase